MHAWLASKRGSVQCSIGTLCWEQWRPQEHARMCGNSGDPTISPLSPNISKAKTYQSSDNWKRTMGHKPLQRQWNECLTNNSLISIKSMRKVAYPKSESACHVTADVPFKAWYLVPSLLSEYC